MTDEKQKPPTTTLSCFLANAGACLADRIELTRITAETTLERESKLRGLGILGLTKLIEAIGAEVVVEQIFVTTKYLFGLPLIRDPK